MNSIFITDWQKTSLFIAKMNAKRLHTSPALRKKMGFLPSNVDLKNYTPAFKLEKFIKKKTGNLEYDLSSHAHRERQEEQITISEIEQALLVGDIIEQYPDDPRGGSCLVAANVENKPIHVVCGKRDNRLLIVTVYRPKLPTWKSYKKRAKELKSRV